MDDEERAYLQRMAKAILRLKLKPADVIAMGHNVRRFSPREQPGFVIRLHRELAGLDMTPDVFAAWILTRAEEP